MIQFLAGYDSHEYLVKELRPAWNYSFSLSAQTSKGSSQNTTTTAQTQDSGNLLLYTSLVNRLCMSLLLMSFFERISSVHEILKTEVVLQYFCSKIIYNVSYMLLFCQFLELFRI